MSIEKLLAFSDQFASPSSQHTRRSSFASVSKFGRIAYEISSQGNRIWTLSYRAIEFDSEVFKLFVQFTQGDALFSCLKEIWS